MVLSPLYRGGNWSLESLRDLLQISFQIGARLLGFKTVAPNHCQAEACGMIGKQWWFLRDLDGGSGHSKGERERDGWVQEVFQNWHLLRIRHCLRWFHGWYFHYPHSKIPIDLGGVWGLEKQSPCLRSQSSWMAAASTLPCCLIFPLWLQGSTWWHCILRGHLLSAFQYPLCTSPPRLNRIPSQTGVQRGPNLLTVFIRVAHFLFYSPEVLWIMALQRYSHLSSQNLCLNMFLSMALGTSQIVLINSGIWGGEVILGYLSKTNIITKALLRRKQESQTLVGAEVRAMRPGVREAGSWKRHGTDYPIYFRRNIALVLNAACKIWLWLLTSKTVR